MQTCLDSVQGPENKIGPVGDAYLGQVENVVTQGGIGHPKPLILGDRVVKAMPPLLVDEMNLRPRGRHEHPPMIAMEATQGLDGRLSRQVLKGDGGVDQAAIEEHPPLRRRGRMVGQGQRDSPSGEGGRIDPRQGRAVARQFLGDDPAARLLDHRVTASAQLGQQSRFAATRAA